MWYKLKRIMIRPNGVEKQIRPKWEWQPWVDTVLYYDFEHTSWTAETDLAWNYNWTYQATPTIWTLSSWKKYFDTQWTNCLNTNSTLSTIDYNNGTVCIWFNMVNSFVYFWQERWGAQWGTIYCDNFSNGQFCLGPDNNILNTPLSLGVWYNIVIVNDWVNTTLYKNGQQMAQKNMTSSTWNRYFHVWWATTQWTPPSQTVPWNLIWNALFWSVIIENKARTAQEIADYFEQTKWNYWL
jgi:hypothetical protein